MLDQKAASPDFTQGFRCAEHEEKPSFLTFKTRFLMQGISYT